MRRSARFSTVLLFALALGWGGGSASGAAISLIEIDSLPIDKAVKAFGELFAGSVKASQTDPSISDIMWQLQASIDAEKRLTKMMAGHEGQLTDDEVSHIVVEIGEIAKSFDAISKVAPEVFKRRSQELTDIDAIGDKIGFKLADTQKKIQELAASNGLIQLTLADPALDAAGRSKLLYTKHANDIELRMLNAAVGAWTKYGQQYKSTSEFLARQSGALDLFFFILKENARVYNAAAQTLNIQKSVRDALRDLNSLQNIGEIQDELVDTWTDLMGIVDQVNANLILTPET